MAFKEFVKELDNKGFEGSLISSFIYSLLGSFVVLAMLYFVFLRSIDGFFDKYGIYLLLSVLSYSVLIPTIRQVRAYKQFTCMSGMMIGMTAGMIAGFLAGYYIGATNGMFAGSVFGMLIGMSIGIYLGLCCGVMGYLEGIMAGFMGGLMGAMTSVMMLNDHLKIMSFIVFIVGATILFGLNYMIYNETREMEIKETEDHWFGIYLNIILSLITALFMIYGPKSPLFGG